VAPSQVLQELVVGLVGHESQRQLPQGGVCVGRRAFAHSLDGTTGCELIQVFGGLAS
jgi:hypothetical protein